MESENGDFWSAAPGRCPWGGSGARYLAQRGLEAARVSGISRVLPDDETAAAVSGGVSDQLSELSIGYHTALK